MDRLRDAWKRLHPALLVAASLLFASSTDAASIVVLEDGFKARALSADGSTLVGHWGSDYSPSSHSVLWTRGRGVVKYDLVVSATAEAFRSVSNDGTVMLATVAPVPMNPGSSAQLWTEADGVIADMHTYGLAGSAVSGDGTTILGFDSVTVEGEFWPSSSYWTYSEAVGPLQAGGIYSAVDAFRFGFISDDGSTVVHGAAGPPPSTAPGILRWNASTGTEWLTSIPGDAEVRGISGDASVIVGTLSSRELFRWSDASGLTQIDPPPASNVDHVTSAHVSTDGQIIAGSYEESGTLDDHVYLWTEAVGFIVVDEMLANLGFEFTDAVSLFTLGASDDGTSIAGAFKAADGKDRSFIIDMDPASPARETVRIDSGDGVAPRALGGRFATGGITFTMDVDAPGHMDISYARLEPGALDGELPDAAGLVARVHPQTALVSWSIDHDVILSPGVPVELGFTYPSEFTPEEEDLLQVFAFAGGAWSELPVVARDPSVQRIVAETGAIPEAVVVVVPTDVVPTGALLGPLAGSILVSALLVLRRRLAEGEL